MKKRLISMFFCTAAVLMLGGCASNNNAKIETSQAAETEAVKTVEKTKVYVSPDWVKSVVDGQQAESADYKILECSWGTVEDAADYKAGHIQGALHMNTDDVESEEYWNIRTPEEIKTLIAEYGITKDTTVICYNASGTNSADDRIAFTLLWAGVENVKCLDGGLESWAKAGYETESTVHTPQVTAADFGTTIPAHPEYILPIEKVKERLDAKDENFKLVSIRSKDEFLGKTSGYGYIDRAGEPQGAIWGHDTDDGSYHNDDGTTVGLDALDGILKESGASTNNQLSFYCGTGWRATIPFLICYENGVSGMTLYDGGWYQWQMDDTLPVQVGDPAQADCQYTTVGELPTDKAAK